MAINESLLVMAPVLQDYLVDKDTGLPLAAGIITLYEENQRSVLKKWYMQQGTNPHYTFVPLPNPMVLSAVGTIQDVSGNDVIPFFYPYDEDSNTPVVQTYYITVQNSNLELQFTRSNFPFTPNITSATSINTNENLISNSGFWRNISANVGGSGTDVSTIMPATNTMSINGANLRYATIAPSQHDGFTFPDIRYVKNVVDGTEFINFKNFPGTFIDNVLQGDPTPQYYLDINCTAPGSETIKYILIPLVSSIYNLSGYPDSAATIQAITFDTSVATSITLGILQYVGTGVNSPAVTQKVEVLSGAWKKYPENLPIPSAQSVPVSTAGDNGLYLQIGIPTNRTFHIGIALPSFYLSDENLPTTSFQTNDEVNAIISSPRTGDVRISNNAFSPYGWTPMNNGVIALNTPTNLPISRINTDVWQLYNLLWNLAQPYANGTVNQICQLYSNVGAAVAYGGSAYADFTTNNRALQLTKMMGQVLLGTVPSSALLNTNQLNKAYATTFTTSNNSGFMQVNFANPMNLFQGMPITFTGGSLPVGIVANKVYFATNASPGSSLCLVAPTFADAIAYTNRIAFAAGSGTIISANTGTTEGEYAHSQLITELAAHNHPNSTANISNTGGGATQRLTTITNANTVTALANSINVASQGDGTAFNVTQPGTFANIFIKL